MYSAHFGLPTTSMEQLHEADLWISAYNILPPVSPVHKHRAGFDEAFATDAHLHTQWQSVLAALDAPPRFEASTRTTPAPPAPPAPSRLSDSVQPFDSAPVHARSVSKFIRQLLRSQNDMDLTWRFFSLGEVAAYFNNFMVDVQNHGQYTCPELATMYLVPQENMQKVWNFRPGPHSFTRKQAAVALQLTVSQLMHAYYSLGFKTWLLST